MSNSTVQTDSQAKIEHNYWLMTQKLQNGDFYNLLNKLRDKKTNNFLFDTVLAIDFGHGETAAYTLKWEAYDYKEGFFTKAARKSLKIIAPDKDFDFHPCPATIIEGKSKIPTMISFGVGKKVIGKDACNGDVFFQQFKKHPGENSWLKYKNNNAVRLGGIMPAKKYTHKEIIEAFIKEVYKHILENNADIKAADDENRLFVCIGCPASKDWLNPEAKKEFEDLIHNITGKDNFAVIPESNAALMTRMLKDNNAILKDEKGKTIKLDLNKGIAIFDLGSSTIDFTYLLPGKRFITNSLRKGGAEIDKIIYKKGLESKGLTIDDIATAPTEVYGSNYSEKVLVDVRFAKEAFYKPNSNRKVGKPVPVLETNFRVNDELMKEVWSSVSGKALLEDCKGFFDTCYAAVNSYGCSNVLICGGTGNVTELVEKIRQVFKNSKIHPFKDPSTSVAQGLCLTKKLEIMGQPYFKEYIENAEKLSKETYNTVIEKISEIIVPEIVNCLMPVIDGLDEKTIAPKELEEKIEKELGCYLNFNNPNSCMAAVSNAIINNMGSFTKKINDRINRISSDIYRDDYIFEFKPEEIVIDAEDDTNPYKIAIEQMISDLLFGKGFIGSLTELIVKTFNLKVSSKKIPKKIGKKNTQNVLTENICSELSKKRFLYDEITNYFMLCAEASLGKAMLYVFDNPIQEM